MKIYTSYFGNINRLPKDLVKIAVCGKAPEWYDGAKYRELAPKKGFFQKWLGRNRDSSYYRERFNEEVLSKLDAAKVLRDLQDLSDGKDCVLLCYEGPGMFCHRHLIKYWLKQNLDIEVEEWAE